MNGVCPCCGRATAAGDELVVSLDANAASRAGQVVLLTPQMAVVASELARAWPGTARHAALFYALYGAGDGPDSAAIVIKVVVSRLRRQLAPLGVTILSVTSVGWRLRYEAAPARRMARSRYDLEAEGA